MKSSNIVFILVAVIALVVGGVLLTNSNKQPAIPQDQLIGGEQTQEANLPSDSVNKAITNDKAPPANAYAPTTGVYQDFDPALIGNAATGDVILFFKAGWCPTCGALDRNINANLDQIPEGVTILKVDYDDSQVLKEKYSVKIQHTLVQVDQDGNEIKQWQGSLKLDQLVSEIV